MGESGGLFGVSWSFLGVGWTGWFADFSDLAIRIILLIWGSFIPSIFYGFGGDMEMVKIYWVMVSFDFHTLFAPVQRVGSGLAD